MTDPATPPAGAATPPGPRVRDRDVLLAAALVVA
jgi:hypothetical protein